MSVSRTELLNTLNDLLQPHLMGDGCPNGLQIEGKPIIRKIVTGVTASQALIDRAVAAEADAIFVHHGYFWKGEDPCLSGMKKKRIATLLQHDISLFAYHLPLDVHPSLGNNVQLAQRLDIKNIENLEGGRISIALKGNFETALTPSELAQRLDLVLGKSPLVEVAQKALISSVAWCTGGGQKYIDLAASQGIDAFITGEVSEQTIHTAREMNIHFFAAGHHATERFGAQAVGDYLAKTLDVTVEFIDIPNPA
ncbi:Nif3-like dinuclear metal center hexameric protein [Paraglaciecola sp.]|uniref:Nif3-like dinuclear metal center hexameric protein n=1 Tax=Pseudomonadati TaxID=3379134 RepID=UPI00273D532A|nr:Nif3-like dinuclear metal center hexameric protein [Paraglaciecola sp.]MDP5029411.1 Nif3-like dinuclear metal center hexameric protein [Paraglaciecola sp.]